ncbi:MAG: M20 family metallopeptidase [Myxococcota bacterium]
MALKVEHNDTRTDTEYEQMVSLRRALHQQPELSGQEQQTAHRIAQTLLAAGLPAKRMGEHGVIVDLPGQGDGPRIALRADTDALPITEATGLPYASCRAGVMHACGHDGHTGILFGAALRLAENPPPLPVRCIWQPAEETGVGAQMMIDAGAIDGVAAIFGGHIDPRFPSGHLIITDGAVNASTDELCIVIDGQQGHGARPHECRDAIVAASHLVVALQTVVSREVTPGQPAVVTIGEIHAGTGPNIIAGQATLRGTIRAHTPAVRAQLLAAVRRVAQSVALTFDVSIDVDIAPGTPALFNDPRWTDIARRAAVAVVGEAAVGVMPELNLGGEDFAVFLQHIPGCYIRFGAAIPERDFAPAHSSRFDFHEPAMRSAAAWMERVAWVAADTVL